MSVSGAEDGNHECGGYQYKFIWLSRPIHLAFDTSLSLGLTARGKGSFAKTWAVCECGKSLCWRVVNAMVSSAEDNGSDVGINSNTIACWTIFDSTRLGLNGGLDPF